MAKENIPSKSAEAKEKFSLQEIVQKIQKIKPFEINEKKLKYVLSLVQGKSVDVMALNRSIPAIFL